MGLPKRLRPRKLGRLGARRTPASTSAAVSRQLNDFTAELPYERESILAFLQRAASETETGSRVLDAGAGEAPYRELFVHCDYVTADWPNSVHPGGRGADVVASLDDLPLDEASFDTVISTQVLEHVAEPGSVLREIARVLRPDGVIWLTVPLVWPLHEEPYDFYRYTSHGLRHLLDRAGFRRISVEPRNGCATTLAQLLAFAPSLLGEANDGHDSERARLSKELNKISRRLARFDHLDAARVFPLGYQARAERGSPSS